MNKKYKLDSYEITVLFKADNVMAIDVEYLPTHEFFSNPSVELMRIKKETVMATLEKKSEKNLFCKFWVIKVNSSNS